ncbi:Hypothetical predicted protein [Olea europaea subsp. europaea]|uniref:Uncharacterized protein n=1 Tax=Olea europaea subsp. europaea TaxID=158383 RepID=A0A8S0UNL8_OLEEU|nr:Hypothetical predicted protein [Olea europaea subsp. europaea]
MEGLRGGLSLLFGRNKAEVEDDNFELQEEDVCIPIVPRIILRANKGGGDDRNSGRQEPAPAKEAASRMLAPIPITDWSKIYPLNPNKELWEATCDLEKAFIASDKQVGFIDFI